MYFYRYTGTFVKGNPLLVCTVYIVFREDSFKYLIKEIKKITIINSFNIVEQEVQDHSFEYISKRKRSKFAFKTKEEALNEFIKNKQSHIKTLETKINSAKKMLEFINSEIL